MGKRSVELSWKPEPDGIGFYYGMAVGAGGAVRIDLLPPRSVADLGDKFLYLEQAQDLWIGFVEGEEVARAPSRAMVEERIRSAISNGEHRS